MVRQSAIARHIEYEMGMNDANRDFNLFRDIKTLRIMIRGFDADPEITEDYKRGYKEGIKIIAST